MKIFGKKNQEFKDAGFSATAFKGAGRMLNTDGSFNVRKEGLSPFAHFSLFHFLTNLPWLSFVGVILAIFLLVNLSFALLYMAMGIDGLIGLPMHSVNDEFMEAFFFSAQTLTTVGYGHITPGTVQHSAVAAIEACFGLLLFAIATGLMYARFARPDGKIVFSNKALVSPYKQNDIALMIRCANATNTNIMEAEVQLLLSAVFDENGVRNRKFFGLELERSRVVFFSMSWTVVHPINDKSPFLNLSQADLAEAEAEIIILFKGFDTTFNQMVYRSTSYKAEDIVWGAKFSGIFDVDQRLHKTIVRLDGLDKYDLVTLPIPEVVEA
jgi:inward rectifier potassium channel